MSQVDNFDTEIQDAQDANPEQFDQAETTDQTTQEAAPEIDYSVKFKESQKEALRLYEENKALREKAELAERLQADQQETEDQTTEPLYPGFEELDEEAQATLTAYTHAVTSKTKEELYKDPAIAFARRSYNEKMWDGALDNVLSKYPELSEHKAEFKTKYFNVNNVPQNVESILGEIAKGYLYDKAREIGAQEERQKQSRVDAERNTGGDRNVRTSRSLDEWRRIAEENPAKFALLTKEYHEDLRSGKLKE
jgi:hypothetical protein